MALSTYTRKEIFDNLESVLEAALVPHTFCTVSQRLRVNELTQMRQVIDEEDLPALFIVEPAVEQLVVPVSSLGFIACINQQITDLQIGLLGMTELELGEPACQIPHNDILDPKLEAIYEAMLADRTRGGNALTTEVQSVAHTGQTQGARFYFAVSLLCPFEWLAPAA